MICMFWPFQLMGETFTRVLHNRESEREKRKRICRIILVWSPTPPFRTSRTEQRKCRRNRTNTLTWMKRIRISISHKYRHNPTIFRRSRIIQWTLTAIAHTLKYFSIKERFLFIARFESMTTNNNNNNCKQTATTSDVCASQCYKNTRLDV